MRDRVRQNIIISMILLCVSLVFYIFFALWDGAVVSPDSQGYINMEMQREPFYPLFLALIRLLSGGFGDPLFWAALVQSILTALATWSLINYLRREWKLDYILSGMLLCIMFATSLLCRFAAGRAAMYSNSIETESICIPLFLLFVRYLLDYSLHKGRKQLLFAGIVSFILISTRKQMYLTLFLIGICILFVWWRDKRYKKGLLTAGLCAAGIFLGCQLFDAGYNYMLRGTLTSHSKDNRFMATMVFYAAERADAEAIADADVREVFERIYDSCEQNEYLKHSAPKGWYGRVVHFGDNYDHIQIDTMGKVLQEYVYGSYEGNPAYLEKKVDAVTQEMIRAVFPRVFGGIAAVFFDNVLSGLVTTVAKQSPVFVGYTVLIYAAYLFLLIWNIKKCGMDKTSILAAFTLVSILLNVAIVSAVIFCQSRYTIYNMPLFYSSGLLLLVNIRRVHGKKREERI